VSYPTIQEALDSLMGTERERLKFLFEQGEMGFTRVKCYDGLFIGCFLDQHPTMEILVTEGKWSIGRK